jgi:RNA-directed DNA polymerase
LLVRSLAGRALATKRVTENTGKKTPGVDGEIWDTPEQKAEAVQRIGHGRNYQPRPLKRSYIPKRNGQHRPLSVPALIDRARQALHLQALQPIAETQADPNSYGFRPKRRCADAMDQCFKVLRLKDSAQWILEADIEGFFDHISTTWMENHIPMNRRVLTKWLKSGFQEHGRWYPTTSGVPQGGIISPAISNIVLDGLEKVVHGSVRERRAHNINFIRWADDFIVTANSRAVLEQTIRPRIDALLAERGVRLSPTKTTITPLAKGFDFLGQTIRKLPRRNGHPAKLRITPSQGSLEAVKSKIRTLCKQAKGATPGQLIDKLNPVLRGWANYHRHVICSETFRQLDSFVWRRLFRWSKLRHPNKTGRWITQRYFPHLPGEAWRFTAPKTGQSIIRVAQTVKPQRHIKVKAHANPFDPAWEAYFQQRERQLTLRASSPVRATILNQQQGYCPGCRQVIQFDQEVELHHRDGNHQNNALSNLVFLHPNCHRQVHYAPDNQTETSRPSPGVGHA